MIYTIYIGYISKNLTGNIPTMSCCIIWHFERFWRLTGLSEGDDVINCVSSWIATMDHFWEKTVSDCTAVPQKVILTAKEIAYHKQENGENR